MSSITTETPRTLALDGAPLRTAGDVAQFFEISQNRLLHALYKAPESARYTYFEIPKKGGGMRKINAPHGFLRDLQDQLLPILQSLYDAHPNAHGFIHTRSIVSNATEHANRRWVLNVDLADFFPSINFGRIRGLFMADPFNMGPAAAAVCAQICTHRNGLPQGAPTSPVLSNFIAASLDRRLTRLARENGASYSRYADDITFSTNRPAMPPNLAGFEQIADKTPVLRAGDPLEKAILESGFSINAKKVRLQNLHQHQSVTGLCVNKFPNVERTRVRKVRAMIHAWEKFGLAAAGHEYFEKYTHARAPLQVEDPGPAFRNIVYGQLAFIKMTRGADNPVFLNLCAKLISLDPNPSKFIRQMAFGAADYDIFISHASEDKAAIARPIFEACERLGLKAFLDEEHIAWGESFTKKINTALGSARTVLAIISNTSVNKDWPVTEVNAALSLEVAGHKTVVALIVGKPDLSRLPILAGKDFLHWTDNADQVARKLRDVVRGVPVVKASRETPVPAVASVPSVAANKAPAPELSVAQRMSMKPADAQQKSPSLMQRLFGKE